MWRQRLENLGSNLAESSTRLRQRAEVFLQPGIPGVGPGGGFQNGSTPATAAQVGTSSQQASPQKDQFLRLPVDSAKKLRWFDKQDLNMLIQLHLREKAELLDANAVLRQELQRRGVSEADMGAEVQAAMEHADGLRQQEAAMNEVLVVSAQAEIERLRDQLDAVVSELQHARRQLDFLQQQQQQQQATSRPPSAAATPRPRTSSRSQLEQPRVRLRLQWPADGTDRVSVELEPVTERELGHLLISSSTGQAADTVGVLTALLEALKQQEQQTASVAPGPSPELLDQAVAAVAQLADQHGVTMPASGNQSADAGSDSASHSSSVAELTGRCQELELEVGRLQGELSQARAEAAFARSVGEQRAQEQRSRVTAAQQQAAELLRVAQDGRLAAEERWQAAERRVALAEERASKLDSEVQDLKAELKRCGQEARRAQNEAAAAEARAAQAEAALQREKALGSRAAELDARSAEVLAQHRSRLAELETAAAQQQRQLAAALQRAEAAEQRLAAAEVRLVQAAAEAEAHEAVSAERDELAARLAVLEGKLDEGRAERGQVQALRELAETAEQRRARAEDELIVTARLAAELEARLAEGTREAESLRLDVQAAHARALAAEQSVEAAVRERWAAAGADRAAWPLAAQEELENVEARLSALHAALKSAQRQAAEEATAREADRAARIAAERAAAAAEDTCSRAVREAQQREQRLEAAASAAAAQVAEFRSALTALERERDELLAEKQQREAAHKAAQQAVAAARRRTGSGALPEAASAPAVGSALGSRSSSAAEEAPLPSASLISPRRPVPEVPDSTELLFLKNVLLKFVDAQINGRFQECEVLLPAVATLLRASPQEFRVLRDDLARAQSWLPALPSLPALTS